MFKGISPINVDAKGRMAIPAKYREQLLELCEGRLVLTVDVGGCLTLFTAPGWDKLVQQLAEMSGTNTKIKSFRRLLVGYAHDCELDGNGRILLPGMLREYANLEKHIVLVGQGNKFEIWNEATWNGSRDAFLAEINSSEGDLPEELEKLSY